MKKILILIVAVFLLTSCGSNNKEEDKDNNHENNNISETIEDKDSSKKDELTLPLNSFDVGDVNELKKEFEKAGFTVVLDEVEMSKNETSWEDGDIFSIYAVNKNDSNDMISVFEKGEKVSSDYTITIMYIKLIDKVENSGAATEDSNLDNEYENNFTKLSKFSLNTQTEYSHIDTETILLGNGEGVLLKCTVSPSTAKEEDILILYDENNFTCKLNNTYSLNDSEVTLEYRLSAKQPCTDYVYVLSTYDYVEDFENASVYELYVHALDSRDGKIVYVTPDGEKYHYSKSCAGEYATTTTLYDAEAYEYEKCGKCAR